MNLLKLSIKGDRDKTVGIVMLTISGLLALSVTSNVIVGGLAWHFATTQRTVTTPMMYNRPFSSDAKNGDSAAMTMFALSFVYLRLNVSPDSIDSHQKAVLNYVASDFRDTLKKSLDIEAERIKKGGITTRYEVQEIREVKPGEMVIKGKLAASTTNGPLKKDLKDTYPEYRIKMSYENGLIGLLDFSQLVPSETTK
ncbi:MULTISPECIES: TraE/TraK family type IV conjugative transfer system protein [Pectobacterium]|uniref:TraE/TraK family type IV conjugative transfer system protein n=1 Tax=Pectobacterium TaxID=122277 RepID=UPI002B23FBB6|nr:TraE/TraK family type IV conjugative transfer system protein [Pectobacterium versatile]